MANRAEIRRMSDSDLVRLAKNGSVDAFEQLVHLHQLELRQFLARRVGDLATADDLAQETFLAAIRQISHLTEDRSFRAWLFTVARNKSIDFLRKRQRMFLQQNDALEAMLVEESMRRIKRHQLGDEASIRDALRVCLEDLNAGPRSLVSSHYFEQVTCQEIAEQRGEKSSTIRMALLRIRKALAKCVRKKVGGEISL